MKEKKVSIVYIITKLELGGAQKVCLSLFNDLKDYNIETVIITGSEGELVKEPFVCLDTLDTNGSRNIILLDSFKREISSKYFFKEIATFFKLVKILRKIKKQSDITIVHTHSTKAGILGRWAAFCAGIKLKVHTIHGFAFHNHQNKIKWFLIYFAELVTSLITTHFICVSSEDVKIGKKFFPKFEQKHSIIRAAIDWKSFYIPGYKAREYPQEKPFVFGTVSCFKPQKNLFDLLASFQIVHKNNPLTRLEIVGDGKLRIAIEAYLKENNMQNCVTLHGWQYSVAPIMMHWNAFVMSSLWEGLPCAVVEARLLKLPVLSYNTGGIHDIIISGKNGFLYEQKDIADLANGMLNISLNKNLYLRLQNYPDDLSDFNDKTMVKEHAKLYLDLSRNN